MPMPVQRYSRGWETRRGAVWRLLIGRGCTPGLCDDLRPRPRLVKKSAELRPSYRYRSTFYCTRTHEDYIVTLKLKARGACKEKIGGCIWKRGGPGGDMGACGIVGCRGGLIGVRLQNGARGHDSRIRQGHGERAAVPQVVEYTTDKDRAPVECTCGSTQKQPPRNSQYRFSYSTARPGPGQPGPFCSICCTM